MVDMPVPPVGIEQGGVLFATTESVAHTARWDTLTYVARTTSRGILAVEGGTESTRAHIIATARRAGFVVVTRHPWSPRDGSDISHADVPARVLRGARVCVVLDDASPEGEEQTVEIAALLSGLATRAHDAFNNALTRGRGGSRPAVLLAVPDVGGWVDDPGYGGGTAPQLSAAARAAGHARQIAREGVKWGVRLLVSSRPGALRDTWGVSGVGPVLLGNASAVVTA